jgi:hypothetical protein
MPNHRRYAHRPARVVATVAFDTTEEAWFWFSRCQRLRREGARFEADRSRASRPCDPDDIAACVSDLARRRVLARPHIRVLAAYGLLSRPPDARDRAEASDARLWDEALDRLATPLMRKGIVRLPDPHPFQERLGAPWCAADGMEPADNDEP